MIDYDDEETYFYLETFLKISNKKSGLFTISALQY